MKTFTKTSFVGIALSMTAFPGLSQDGAQENTAQVYQVELLIFRHTDQTRTTPEIPRLPEPQINDVLEQDLPKMGDGNPGNAPISSAGLVPGQYMPESGAQDWVLVAQDSLLLNGVANRLNSLAAYDLVDHLGWVQTAPDVSQAEQIDLTDLGLPEYVATGKVNLYQQRYLHLAVDIAMANAGGSNTGNTNGSFADTLKAFRAPTAMPAINESRRIRLENLVYFDQPQFGVLAMVSRSDKALPEN